MKSLILGATMIMALPIIGGCGSNTIGYGRFPKSCDTNCEIY